jgi:hypothetical protein
MSEYRKVKRSNVPLSDRILAVCYGTYGVAVGGFFFLGGLIGTQGAASATQATAMVAAAALMPVPMLLTALALGLGLRWARPLAALLPAILEIYFLAVSYSMDQSIGDSWVHLARRPAAYQFLAYYGDIQMANLPGAAVLALVTQFLMIQDAMKRPADLDKLQGRCSGAGALKTTVDARTRRFCIFALFALLAPLGWIGCKYEMEERNRNVWPQRLPTEQRPASKVALFDGQSTDGWRIEGPCTVATGTLRIGGTAAPAIARLEREFRPGETIHFQFTYLGPRHGLNDARLRIEPNLNALANEQMEGAGRYPPENELSPSDLTAIGAEDTWTCRDAFIRTRRENGVTDDIELHLRVGWSKTLTSHEHRASAPISSFKLLFETAAGNQLLLRELYVTTYEAGR